MLPWRLCALALAARAIPGPCRDGSERPVKRSAALAELSRDHHHALAIAARLRRATPDTAVADREALLDYWDHAGRRHFRDEEEILLPAYAAHADPHHPLVARVLCELVAIRALVAGVEATAAPVVERLQALGAALAHHVRLEERRLFGLIEATLPAADLERLATLLAPAGAGHSRPAGRGDAA